MDLHNLSENQDKLLSKLEKVKKELSKNPNVLAVGVGMKEKNKQFTDEISFRVFVAEKKSLKSLKANEVIPTEIEAIKTDVLTPYQVCDRPDVCGDERRENVKHRPLKAGIAVSTKSNTYGTLGWFGTLDSDGTTILLTNKHVLYDSTSSTDTTVLPTAQPKLGKVSKCCCCECGSDDVIGETIIGIRDLNPPTSTSVDCAIAKINTEFSGDISFNITNDSTDEVLTVSGTAAAVVGETVRKIGARSAFTTGRVVHIGDTAVAGTDPDGGTITIRTGQVLIIPDPSETYQVLDADSDTCKFAFSNNGDSGSVILNASDEIVALLYGGDETTNSVDITFANNIANVLAKLSSNSNAITLSTSPSGSGLRSDTVTNTVRKTSTGKPNVKNILEKLREANDHSLIRKLYDKHFEEVLELVNHCRPVTVVWQRLQGPAYVAAIARAARVENYKIPKEINGSGREELLVAMYNALIENGSGKLKQELLEHGEKLILSMMSPETIEDFANALLKAGYLDKLPIMFNPVK
ncbi:MULTISPECIES: hypothetical protein [unclassified Saccharicrinis]|uniref:hypothetical protein n=1 Tax=unclassified Saccharicrinis TaxID=2646859 RepID=UPI003D347D16